MSIETSWQFATQQKWYGRTNPNVARSRQGQRWTPEEHSQLLAEWRMGKTICTIADDHGRTPTGICGKLEELLGHSYDRYWAKPGQALPAKALAKTEKKTSTGNIEAQIKAKLQQLAQLDALREQINAEIAVLRDKLDEPLPTAFIGDPYADQDPASDAA